MHPDKKVPSWRNKPCPWSGKIHEPSFSAWCWHLGAVSIWWQQLVTTELFLRMWGAPMLALMLQTQKLLVKLLQGHVPAVSLETLVLPYLKAVAEGNPGAASSTYFQVWRIYRQPAQCLPRQGRMLPPCKHALRKLWSVHELYSYGPGTDFTLLLL